MFLKPFNLDHSPARADGEAASAVGGRGGPTEHSRPTDPQARGSLGPSWNKSCPSCMFLERPETGERPSAPYSRIPARVCCLTCKRRVKKDKTQPGWKSRVGLNESLWKLRAGPGRAGQLGAPSAEQGDSDSGGGAGGLTGNSLSPNPEDSPGAARAASLSGPRDGGRWDAQPRSGRWDSLSRACARLGADGGQGTLISQAAPLWHPARPPSALPGAGAAPPLTVALWSFQEVGSSRGAWREAVITESTRF